MKKHLQNILTFIIIFFIVNMVVNFFFKPGTEEAPNTLIIKPIHNDFEIGTAVSLELKNGTSSTVTLKNTCPNEPVKVLENMNGQWVEKHKQAQMSCDGTGDVVLKAGEKHTISLANWNHALFNETGKYKVQAVVLVQEALPAPTQQTASGTTQTSTATETQIPYVMDAIGNTTKIVESPEFEIKPQGVIGWAWTAIFYQPIYNILIFLINATPGRDLGLGIILLTLLIRTILLIPNQKALEAQRKMQDVQPKLDRIREKYKDNQEMIGKETLAVMAEHKVNPMGSCLPLLIQFPVLIALFYVVQNGLNPDNAYLLYSPLQNFDYSKIAVNFLGILDLTKVNTFVLPIFVGGLQFLQMKLALARNNKKKDAQNQEKPKKNEMEAANGMMLYFMPALIAIFTASAPAGVGIYWSVSTLYGIGQQMVVNAKADKAKSKVRVIEAGE